MNTAILSPSQVLQVVTPPPAAGSLWPRFIDPRCAVALGGLAGNNAHGAGFMHGVQCSGVAPVLITCTSGQIRIVDAYLQGLDLLAFTRQRLLPPCGKATDANIAFNTLFWFRPPIRATLWPELPIDLAGNVLRSVGRFWSAPQDYSFWREALSLWPARTLQPWDTDGEFEEIAERFNAREDIGIVFNAYDFEQGVEHVYMNEQAFRLTGKRAQRSTSRPWVVYAPITAEALRDALRLYEYGFEDHPDQIDGAYIRDLIVSEIPHADNAIATICVVRPQARGWKGPAPTSLIEREDLKTEVNFNGSYLGERQRIDWVNRLLEAAERSGVRPTLAEALRADPGNPLGVLLNGRRVTIVEVPLQGQRGWLDYALESQAVFDAALRHAQSLWRCEAEAALPA